MNLKSDNQDKNKYPYFWLLSIVSLLAVAGLWYLNLCLLEDEKSADRGTFGDMFGAVNAIFSGLAFAGIIISLYLQRIDLKNQLDQLDLNHQEVKQTNREFKLQNTTLQVQKFENQYYKMIDLHKSNVDGLSISYRIDTMPFKTVRTEHVRVIGKEVFVSMATELHTCLSVSNEVLLGKYDSKEIFLFAYSIFFWGLNSDYAASKIISIVDQKSVKDSLSDKQESFVENTIEGKPTVVKTRYTPFKGHESRLAHYYRHLFQTVKHVVNQEKNGLITYHETRQYLRVLRAQLSNSEQLMLYYNYICGFGSNWDKLGDKGFQFLTKYRMIHNIPIDKVEFVEPPREHFKEFIEKEATKEDPLFEWGDLIEL